MCLSLCGKGRSLVDMDFSIYVQYVSAVIYTKHTLLNEAIRIRFVGNCYICI